MTFWIFSNFIFVILIQKYFSEKEANSKKQNDGHFGFLEIISVFLAGMVAFKTFFAAYHILWFKILYTCSKKYRIYHVELKDQAKSLIGDTRYSDFAKSFHHKNELDKKAADSLTANFIVQELPVTIEVSSDHKVVPNNR